MIRGYSVQQQLNFLQTQYPARVSERLMGELPPDIRKGLGELKAAEWYPRAYSVAILRAIASNSEGNEAAARNDLQRCGTFIATEATNTFLKLLMKLMTPKLFCKKIPEFWSRDQKGGYFEVENETGDDNLIRLKLCDVEGFDHIAGVSLGWISYGLTAMGKGSHTIDLDGWSLENPGPRNAEFQIRWT